MVMSPFNSFQKTCRTDRRTRLRTRRSRLRSPAHLLANHLSLSMSPKRASSFVGADDRVLVRSRRDRQIAFRSMRVVGTVCESEPWRDCGKARKSTERPKCARRHATVLRLRASSADWAQPRTASLDRLAAKRLAGIARPSDQSPHCAARPNPGRKVRRQSPGPLILNAFSLQEPARHLSGWHRTFPKSMCRQTLASQIDRRDIVAFILPS
jgi:hypothetical protein